MPAKTAQAEDHLDRLEEAALVQTSSILEAALAFADVENPEDLRTPPNWREKYGDDADRRYRIAKMALLPKAQAPAGLQIAVDTFRSMVRARAGKSSGSQTLNVAIHVPYADTPPPEYDVVEIPED